MRECDFENDADLDNEIENLVISVNKYESKANPEDDNELKVCLTFHLLDNKLAFSSKIIPGLIKKRRRTST